jgi:hypothetical protein
VGADDTGQAPEVTLCRPYNEKADVFSFAIILYELLIRTSTVSMLIDKGVADIEQVEMYAQKVRPMLRDFQP